MRRRHVRVKIGTNLLDPICGVIESIFFVFFLIAFVFFIVSSRYVIECFATKIRLITN